MSHETLSEGQFRQFENALGVEARRKAAAGERRNAQAVLDFMKHGSRLYTRGMLTLEGFSFPTPEQEVDTVAFTDQEKEALKHIRKTEPVFYLPTGETIRSQQGNRRMNVYPAGYEEEDGTNRLLDYPSRKIEVAIWADPKKPEEFFIPGSFNKTTDQQDKLRAKEAEKLSKKPGLSGITIIRPEASEVTEVMFQHFDKTGVRLLGQDWVKDGYWRYIRTNTPTTKFGSSLAHVGSFGAGGGPGVGDWGRDKGRVRIGVAFWVVPNRSR